MAPKSMIWQYFTKDNSNALCTICGKCLLNLNTTNLWAHLQAKHLNQYLKLRANEENQNSANKSDQESPTQHSGDSQPIPDTDEIVDCSDEMNASKRTKISEPRNTIQTTSQLRQTTLGKQFTKLSKFDNERICSAIAYFVAVDCESYSIVERKGFNHLMKVIAPTFTIPTRTTFSERKIPKLFADTKKCITKKMSNIRYFGLTTDGWTSPNRHKFIALTCSYIDDEWDLKSHTLACHDLNVSNTGENITVLILNELSEYRIEKSKVSSVTTDRGANVLLAVDLMGFLSIPCFGHVINTKMEEMMEIKFIAPTIKKIKAIYSTLSFSSNARAYLSSCQLELNMAPNVMPSTSKTRWWSEIDQFKFVVKFEMALYKFVTSYPGVDNAMLLDVTDISRIQALLLVMEPMQKFTTTLGSEKIVTASFIPPLIEKLNSIFDKFNYHDVVASFEMKKFFRSIPKFCRDLYIEEKSHVEMATYLDPRFKSVRRNDLDDILVMEINGIIESRESDSNQTVKVTDEKNKPKTALQELFADEDLCSVESADEEIKLYHSQVKIKITDCPLKWWKARSSMFPNISIVAKKYLCMPATSVLSERIFNDGKEIMTDNRFRLTDNHMEQLVFLSMNSENVPLK